MDTSQIGKIPYGYIYVSFFPATEKCPIERFYIGQKKLNAKAHWTFDQKYHGSGKIVRNYIKANPTVTIRTYCLTYAYTREELNRLEYYWVSFKIKGKE